MLVEAKHCEIRELCCAIVIERLDVLPAARAKYPPPPVLHVEEHVRCCRGCETELRTSRSVLRKSCYTANIEGGRSGLQQSRRGLRNGRRVLRPVQSGVSPVQDVRGRNENVIADTLGPTPTGKLLPEMTGAAAF